MSHITRHKVLTGIGAVAAVLAIGLGTTACVDETKPKKVGSAQDSGTEDKDGGEEKGAQTFKVGDKIALGDWQFVVHEVTDPLKPTNDFITPQSGNRWVAIDLEVTNKGSKSEEFSTMLALELKDSKNKLYNIAITGEEAQKQPDGTVGAGESRRGTVVYEVPESANGLQLAFKPDLFGGGKAAVELGG